MGLLEEILRMKQSGLAEEEIVSKLQEQGNTYRAISEAISQSRIKQAIEEPAEMNENRVEQNYAPEVMQQSVMQQEAQQQEYFQGYEQPAVQQDQGYQQQNYDYSQSSQGFSSDTIMEISEQIVSEKLSDVRKKLEKMANFKTELETKTESIEERLKRIEKIIDTLQSSVLRKVGDYVTNVEDIKHELIETQKTFAKVLGSRHQNKKH